jgi:uncharacterized protein (TIGR02246 family)
VYIPLLAVLLVSCTETPTILTPDGDSVVSEARLASNPPGQERQVEALVTAAEAAWAAKDAAAYAALFAEDAEFISPFGTYLSGREAIRAQHVLLFRGPFAGSNLDITVRRITFLTGTVAIMDLEYRLTDYRFLVPGLIPTEPGVFRTTVRWVVQKQRGEWVIVGLQITPVLPAP